MRVIVENTPKDERLFRSFTKIVSEFTNPIRERTPSECKEWLDIFYGGEFFVYKGGSHIAVHERNEMGEPMEDRLIIAELK